jgi:hypothetical protein
MMSQSLQLDTLKMRFPIQLKMRFPIQLDMYALKMRNPQSLQIQCVWKMTRLQSQKNPLDKLKMRLQTLLRSRLFQSLRLRMRRIQSLLLEKWRLRIQLDMQRMGMLIQLDKLLRMRKPQNLQLNRSLGNWQRIVL